MTGTEFQSANSVMTIQIHNPQVDYHKDFIFNSNRNLVNIPKDHADLYNAQYINS